MELEDNRRFGRVALAVAIIVAIGAGFVARAYYAEWSMQRALLLAYPDAIPLNPELANYAAEIGQPAAAQNCASCHGAELKGDQSKGAPNLTDKIWLFDFGDVSDIERTVMYGIRSGHSKMRNVTDMPGLGSLKRLTPEQVNDVVDYTLSLTSKQGDPAVLARGKELFEGDGLCYDCHARDGAGSPDYGAPSLTDNEWIFGGDRATVLRSVNDGRHGLCPAFIDKLDLATIRGIAIYIHRISHPANGTEAAGTNAPPAANP